MGPLDRLDRYATPVSVADMHRAGRLDEEGHRPLNAWGWMTSSLPPQTLPSFLVPVDSESIRRFAAAIGLPEHEYSGPGVPCPPTFLTIAPYLWARRHFAAEMALPLTDLDVDPGQLLLAEEEHVFHGALPRAGTTLRARTWLDDVSGRQGRRGGALRLYRLRTDLRGLGDDDLVASVFSTVVATENVPVQGSRLSRYEAAIPNELIGSWSVGPITRSDISLYQAACGDTNPLHHDERFAIASGYPTVISMAMLHAGWLSSRLVRRMGRESVRRLRARARGVAYPGDILLCRGRIDDRRRDGERKVVNAYLQAMRGGSELICELWAECALEPSQPPAV